MFQNYQYFLTICEEMNITKAADKLFISHQALSKYLRLLEKECNAKLFERKPVFSLTRAGEMLRDAFRKVERIDLDLAHQLEIMQNGEIGEIKIGITEGRMRLLLPYLLEEFKPQYPKVEILLTSAATPELLKLVSANKLDIILVNAPDQAIPHLAAKVVLQESLYLVIADKMLAEYFPDSYPQCCDDFSKGVDLKDFGHVPFVLSHRDYNSRKIIEQHLKKTGAALKCITETSAMDFHHLISVRGYAASFCWSMYRENIKQLSGSHLCSSPLHVFPIKGLEMSNTVVMIYGKDRLLPDYARKAMAILKQLCKKFATEKLAN